MEGNNWSESMAKLPPVGQLIVIRENEKEKKTKKKKKKKKKKKRTTKVSARSYYRFDIASFRLKATALESRCKRLFARLFADRPRIVPRNINLIDTATTAPFCLISLGRKHPRGCNSCRIYYTALVF